MDNINRNRNERKIAIGGCPRSGTSALAQVLSPPVNYECLITHETSVFSLWRQPMLGRFSKVIIDSNKWRFLYSGIRIAEYLKETKGRIGEEAFNVMCEMAEGGIRVFGDKVPHGYLANAISLMDDFPNMKFLFTQRDGRGVIASQLRRGRRSLAKNPKFVPAPGAWPQVDIKVAQKLWIECSTMLKRIMSMDSSRVLVVKFEDLLSDTEQWFRNIEGFLELERPLVNRPWNIPNNPDKVRGRYLHSIKTSNADLWRKEIPNVMDEVSNEFKKHMEFFGYI